MSAAVWHNDSTIAFFLLRGVFQVPFAVRLLFYIWVEEKQSGPYWWVHPQGTNIKTFTYVLPCKFFGKWIGPSRRYCDWVDSVTLLAREPFCLSFQSLYRMRMWKPTSHLPFAPLFLQQLPCQPGNLVFRKEASFSEAKFFAPMLWSYVKLNLCCLSCALRVAHCSCFRLKVFSFARFLWFLMAELSTLSVATTTGLPCRDIRSVSF